MPITLGLVALMACSAPGEADPEAGVATSPGEALFVEHCAACHGRDGSMGMHGAKDLSRSMLTEAEMIFVVTNGKSAMAGFSNTLTKQQVAEVVEYVRGIRNQQSAISNQESGIRN